MVFAVAAVALFCLARLPAALAHARVSSPPIRTPGPAFQKACGQTSFNSVSQDPTGHIEEQEPVNAGCELTLCRGMLFADQPASNVLTVQPSQAMEMSVDCTIPHGGPANVTLIDTTVGGTGAQIGSFLKTFDDFCPTSGPTPADQTNLQYNLPDATTIGNKCSAPGDCVVQLFWASQDLTQNYYYCVDVVMAAAQTSSTPVAAAPATTAVQQAPTTVVATPTPVVQPTVVATSAAPILVSMASAPVAAVPSKMVTSVGGVNAAAAAGATGIAAAVNGTTAVNAASANAGRRRARILWF